MSWVILVHQPTSQRPTQSSSGVKFPNYVLSVSRKEDDTHGSDVTWKRGNGPSEKEGTTVKQLGLCLSSEVVSLVAVSVCFEGFITEGHGSEGMAHGKDSECDVLKLSLETEISVFWERLFRL